MDDKTFGVPVEVFAFGDQTYNAAEVLSSLLQANDDPIVADFLERSSGVLKHEVNSLTSEQRSQCPRFASLADLVPSYRAGTLNPALVQALTCIAQLGTFLRYGYYARLEHSSGGLTYPTADSACVTGVCTGALAAVAISSATSIAALAPLALHTVAVALRLGALAWDVAQRISTQNNPTAGSKLPSWASAVAGLNPDDARQRLEQYAAERRLPRTAAPYLSAYVGPTQVSIAGPPPTLSAFLATLARPACISTPLPITAPYHAPHLYTDADVDRVVGHVLSVSNAWPSTRIPIVSAAGAEQTTAQSCVAFPTALADAVRDCLARPIALDQWPASLAQHIQSRGANYVAKPHPIALAFADRLGPLISTALPTVQLLPSLPEQPSLPSAAGNARAAKSPIAIVAASGRFPQADSMDAFWQVLSQGLDTHELVPPSRWNAATHVGSGNIKNVSGTGFGCWLHNAGRFDAGYFNMSPREAPQVDPAQRLALLTAAEALEQAGIVPDRTPSTQKNRVGVYFGSTSNDWMETNSAQNIDTYFIPGGNRAFIPGRINYHFKFSGPSYTIDTACSSSLTALHMACNALWRGEVDTAIVGGTNVLTNPDMTAGLDKGHFLSRTGNCKTFDDNADGYCRGEAVVTLLLKRHADAEADKDPIQACILGVATNHSAEAESITRPLATAQQDLFAHLLADAGVSVQDISYCEMHGTGTQAGDAAETTSVVESLAPITAQGSPARSITHPLHIGAAKSNVGHGEAAAGVTSLAKVLLMMKHSKIPPHCGIKTKINRHLPDLAARNTFIAKQATAWLRPQDGKRRVLLNNFSAAGGNTALVLEDAPVAKICDEPDSRNHHIVVVSAKTTPSLANNLRNLIAWIDKQDQADPLLLPRLSYTTTVRRMHLRHRVAVAGSNIAQIRNGLLDHLLRREKGDNGPLVPVKGPSFVFAFTGQGSPFAGMGADLYARFEGFRSDIYRYDQLCVQLDLPSILPMFQDATAFESASPTLLQLTHVCFQMALCRLWQSFGLKPKAVVGHSLGEYAALFASGALSQADVIYLVGTRAQLMEKHLAPGTHAMLVAFANEARVSSILGPVGSDYEISCINGKENIVLGGEVEQLERAQSRLETEDIRCFFLKTPFAFHTSQVDPILEHFLPAAAGSQISAPHTPVISPTKGAVLRDSSDFELDYFVQHCRKPVDMVQSLTAAKEQGLIDDSVMGVEIGPAPVVTAVIKDITGSADMQTFASVRNGKDTWELLSRALSRMYMMGADIAWSKYHQDFPGCQQVLELPAYGWNLKEYWMQYVHDWSLRKGDPPVIISAPSLETSSIHKVITNTITGGGSDGGLVVDANLSREDLHPMVQGHQVYGVPLCTPSVYADIALTIGEYIKQMTSQGGNSETVEVAEMNIQSALVANDSGKVQNLRTAVKFDAKKKSAYCTFSSVSEDGSKVIEQHANCLVRFCNVEKSKRDLAAAVANAKSRIDTLQGQVGTDENTYRFSKGMIYKMIGQLADFDEKYRGLSAITLDNDAMEAAGMISFKGIPNEGKFTASPAYLDALSQLGGFVMNANEGVDLEKEVFVNHGWKSLRFFTKLDPAMTYYSHVKMTEGEDKLWMGDVIIFDEKRNLVGIVGGVSLQGVPKRLMHYIVTAANKKVSGEPKTTAKSSPAAKPAAAAAVPTAQTKVTTTTTSKAVKAAPAGDPPLVTSALQIVSEEIGMELNALTDDVCFNDAGLDSLLSLVISSRMRDQLEIDFESAQFLEIGSIGALKKFLRDIAGASAPVEEPVIVVEEKVVQEEAIETAEGTHWPTALNILSEESGIVPKDLTDEVAFADVGVDSLLSLVITSRLRDELDVDLPDRALFQDCTTVGGLRERFFGSSASSSSGSASPEPEQRPGLVSMPTATTDSVPPTPWWSDSEPSLDTPPSELEDIAEEHDLKEAEKPKPTGPPKERLPPAWSMYLQGSPKRSTETLFLFPDGCGSATSYLNLPRIGATTAIVGFNSPFMKTPENMHGREVSEIVDAYIQGVRKRQPQGPYHLGGWSAGGILAYAVAQELLAQGEQVSTLLLIDSPPPIKGLDHLPQRFFDHCNNVGLFGTEMQRGSTSSPAPNNRNDPPAPPAWLVPHFRATINLLHEYVAPPMTASSSLHPRPKVSIIWAGDSAFDGKHYAHLPPPLPGHEHEDTEGMKFLSVKREDYGPDEWSSLFPGMDVTAKHIPGEHHFSMMRDKGADVLAPMMREALGVGR